MNQPGRWERALRLAPNSIKPDAVAQIVQRMLLELPRDGVQGAGEGVDESRVLTGKVGVSTKRFKVKR